MRLKDKVIFVTGGHGLLGRSICERAISEGAICIAGEKIVEKNYGKSIECDVTSADSIKMAVNQIHDEYGRIDGLVNAAYPRTKDWGESLKILSLRPGNENVNLQMNSVFLVCQQVLSIMKKQKKGSIVNLASIYGSVGPDFSVYEGTEMTMPAAYSAIKGGIINFTKYLASYYGRDQVRINCVSPGGIFDNQLQSFVEKYESKVPLKRMGNPADISSPVCFLLSDESSYITGHNLIVDGGWSII